MRVVPVILLLGLAAPAEAQPMLAPPPSGLYESWSPVDMGPVGLLAAPLPSWLPRWLEVATSGRTARITFRPEGRVVWRVRWGPHGVVQKDVEVDGAAWLRSTFDYGPDGCVLQKTITGRVTDVVGGPGASWTHRYRCDARGRIVARSGTSVQRRSFGSRNLPVATAPENLDVVWTATGSRSTLSIAGHPVRRDDLDLAGRPLRTTLFGSRQGTLAIVYRRDGAGRLRAIESEEHLGPRGPGPGMMAAVSPMHLDVFAQSTVERFEAEILLGAPVRTTDAGRGAQRRITLDWSPDCWLNATSGLEFDPTGLLVDGIQPCICGFCVDAALPLEARSEVLVEDTHRTRGPWVRLDGAVDVTTDHEVMTPDGPRRAGALAAGDAVLDASGAPRRLRSVERLGDGPPRLGRNLRTRDGTFSAGGILFRSEEPRPCSP